MNTLSPLELRLARMYDASPEDLFDAWTTPETLVTFLGPREVTVSDLRMDVRPGGKYRLVMNLPDGEKMPTFGEYREVDRPRRLSFTWTWEEDRPEDQTLTLLTLEFVPHGKQTELILTHRGFKSEESRENHRGGWTSILEKLALRTAQSAEAR